MKKLLLFSLFLLGHGCAMASNTTVTATVVDKDSTTWANGSWNLAFIPAPNYPDISIYNINGTPLSNATLFQNGTMSNSGVITLTTYDSSTITPSGSSWKLTVCPNASAPCGIYSFATATSSMDVSSGVNNIIPAPRFKAVAGAYGYVDAEATVQTTPGSTYYNVQSSCQKYYNAGVWACVSSSGTGFLPLTGGTLTGPLIGTTANFTQLDSIYTCPNTTTVAACLAVVPAGGTLQLQSGIYTAGSFATCYSTPNVTVIGAGQPQFNSGNTALVGGTIIQGTVNICANNVTFINGGNDVGSAWVGLGNSPANGLVFDGPTGTGSDPILTGATIINWTVLGAGATNAFHDFLVEHYTGVSLFNLQARLNQHCIALKSSNAIVSGFKAQSCSVDGFAIKGDAYTQVSNITASDITINNVVASDTNGVQIEATGSTGTASKIAISNVVVNGAVSGVALTNSSTVGNGALSDITLNGFNVTLTPTGALPPTCGITAGTAHINNVNIDNFTCDNESSQAAAPFSFNNWVQNGTYSNLNFINGGFASDIEGIVTINGIADYGPSAPSQFTIFNQTSSATVLTIYGASSTRGNYVFSTNVGATAYVSPPPNIMSYPGGSTVAFTGPITAKSLQTTDTGGSDTINFFSNTGGGASYVQTKGTSSLFSGFESITSGADWLAGNWGTTDYSIVNRQGGGSSIRFKLNQSTGQPTFSYLSSAGCLQTDAFGNISSTGTACGSGGGGGGVTSINSTAGAFTFTGGGVSCSGTTCTFTTGGGSGTVTSFAAPSGSWPTWLVPTVTNSTTTPSLAVAASPIPNAALANSSVSVNSTTCTLGSSCNPYNLSTSGSLPGTCTVGQLWTNPSPTNTGNVIYECYATNSWIPLQPSMSGTPSGISASNGAGSGFGGTAAFVSGATDGAGWVTVNTGTSTTASAGVFTVSFSITYPVTPKCSVFPADPNSAALSGTGQVWVSQGSATGALFVVRVGSTVLTPGTTFTFGYRCSLL